VHFGAQDLGDLRVDRDEIIFFDEIVFYSLFPSKLVAWRATSLLENRL